MGVLDYIGEHFWGVVGTFGLIALVGYSFVVSAKSAKKDSSDKKE